MKSMRLARSPRRLAAFVVVLSFLVLLIPSAGQPVKASETSAGDTAVTMWAVVFNDPQNCIGGCGEDDLDRPAVNPSVLYVTGQRVQSNGRAAFAGAISESSLMGVLFGPGLVDPAAAEIHLILRSHGRVIPALLASQVSSLNGGCPPNACTDLQFAVHMPDAADAMGVSNSAVQSFPDGSTVHRARSMLRRTPNGAFAVVETRL